MPSLSECAEAGRFQLERLYRWRHLRRQPAEADDRLRAAAAEIPCDAPSAAQQLTDLVVDYLWEGHLRALAPTGTLAFYPGAPSIYGARNDAIEGVTRILPLWAAAANAGNGASDRRRQMQAQLRLAILNGCDPQHPGYWGTIDDYSTLICEAADVALALWLSRLWLWDTLDSAEQARIAGWLGRCAGKRTVDNNWHLFVVLVDATLAALDPGHMFTSGDRLARIMEFARPDGCFADGPQGSVDLYNAWGFHYALYWLRQIQPDLAPAAADRMLDEFCQWYRYLFTRDGLPLWGRSLCYRLATPAPLLASALSRHEAADTAATLAAYAATLAFFVNHGALRHGRPSQGVFGDDLRWLDPYSGPASSLWGTRSIVLFLHGSNLFTGSRATTCSLPAERDRIDRWLPALGARLLTEPADRISALHFAAETAPLHLRSPFHQTARDRLRQAFLARGIRRSNESGQAPVRLVGSDMAQFTG